LGELPLTHLTQRAPERVDAGVGQPVVDVEAVFAPVYEPSLPQHAQVLRGVGDRERGLLRQVLDRALTLRKQVKQFQPLRAGERLPNAGELRVELVFELTMSHSVSSLLQLHSFHRRNRTDDCVWGVTPLLLVMRLMRPEGDAQRAKASGAARLRCIAKDVCA